LDRADHIKVVRAWSFIILPSRVGLLGGKELRLSPCGSPQMVW
jgi:hypothetical protein